MRKRFRRKKNYVNRDCVGYITNVRTYSARGEKIFMGELLIDNYFLSLPKIYPFMNVRFTILTTTMFALMACNNQQQEIAVAEDALANTQKAEEARDKSNERNPFGAGGANFSNNVSLPATQQGVKLNPPHGEPGHRCDIAVGAPLPNDGNVIAQTQTQAQPVSSADAKPVVSGGMPQVQQVQVAQPQTQQGVATKGQKLNPPHGQPGHRCDIPVGAPLNSKPVKQQVPATSKTVEQQIVIDPKMAQQHTGTTEPGFSGKPNPPHGQPGHRCDIAVGAILP